MTNGTGTAYVIEQLGRSLEQANQAIGDLVESNTRLEVERDEYKAKLGDALAADSDPYVPTEAPVEHQGEARAAEDVAADAVAGDDTSAPQ